MTKIREQLADSIPIIEKVNTCKQKLLLTSASQFVNLNKD